jgi:hypothetical protein
LQEKRITNYVSPISLANALESSVRRFYDRPLQLGGSFSRLAKSILLPSNVVAMTEFRRKGYKVTIEPSHDHKGYLYVKIDDVVRWEAQTEEEAKTKAKEIVDKMAQAYGYGKS